MCTHENHMLMGTKDGIVCRGCGATFKSFAEISAPSPGAAPDAEKAKKTRKKKEAAPDA